MPFMPWFLRFLQRAVDQRRLRADDATALYAGIFMGFAAPFFSGVYLLTWQMFTTTVLVVALDLHGATTWRSYRLTFLESLQETFVVAARLGLPADMAGLTAELYRGRAEELLYEAFFERKVLSPAELSKRGLRMMQVVHLAMAKPTSPRHVKYTVHPSTVTLEDAKTWLRSKIDDGAECPCCKQIAKVYKRSITASMAYALILIEHRFRKVNDWQHIPSLLTEASRVGAAVRGGDWAKLVHWGLLVEKDEERADGSPRAGFYKITQLGIDFVHKRVSVPKYIRLYDGRALASRSTATITIEDALGQNFSYAKLMAGV